MELYFYAKFLLVITHRNTLQTKKKDSDVSVFKLLLNIQLLYLSGYKCKMPTLVGILTFIRRIDTTAECFKAQIKLYALEFHAQLS